MLGLSVRIYLIRVAVGVRDSRFAHFEVEPASRPPNSRRNQVARRRRSLTRTAGGAADLLPPQYAAAALPSALRAREGPPRAANRSPTVSIRSSTLVAGEGKSEHQKIFDSACDSR